MTMVTSCSLNKTSNTDMIGLTGKLENNKGMTDTLEYEIESIESENVTQIYSGDNKLLYKGEEKIFYSDSYLSVLDPMSGAESKIQLNEDVYGSIVNVRKSEDTIVFSCDVPASAEYGKKTSDSLIALYNINNGEIKTNLIEDEYIKELSLIQSTGEIICITNDYDIYVLNDTLDIIEMYNVYDSIEENAGSYGSDLVNVKIVSESGDLYVSLNNTILKFGRSGLYTLDWNITIDDMGESSIQIGTLADGCVLAYSEDLDYYYINTIDAYDGKTESRYELEKKGKDIFINGSEKCDYCLFSNGKVEMYKFGNDDAVSEFSYDDWESLKWGKAVLTEDRIYSVVLPEEKYYSKLYSADKNGTVSEMFSIDGQEINYRYIFDDDRNVYSLSEEWMNEAFNPESGTVMLNMSINKNSQNGNEMIALYSDLPGYELCGVTENYLFFSKNISSFRLYNKQGEIINEFFLDIDEFIAFSDKSGDEVVYYTDNSHRFYSYNINTDEKKEITEVNELCANAYSNIYYDGGIYDIYIETESALYTYDLTNGNIEKVISDISQIAVQRSSGIIVFDNVGTMACIDYSGKIFLIKPAKEISDCKTINLAMCGEISNTSVYNKIQDYNNSSKLYRISTNSYKSTDSLNLDIAAGRIPDIIISTSDFNIDNYAEMDMFSNLKTIIENDSEFRKKDYYLNLLYYYTYNENVYKIFPAFTIELMACKGEISNTDSINDFWDKLSKTKIISQFESKEELFYDFAKYIIDSNDANAMNDSIGSDYFKNLLELMKNEEKIVDCTEQKYFEVLNENKDVIMPFEAIGFDSINKNSHDSDVPLTIRMFPSQSGETMFIDPCICFSISEKCSEKDEAWRIVKDMFLDYSANGYFSVERKSNIEAKNECSVTSETKQIIENLDRDLETVIKGSLSDNIIKSIILEEANEYYSDAKTADETINSIRKRVSLYMNERK